MRERINSIEELEVMGIDFESKEVQQTITLMQEYWNRDIEVYLKDTQVYGLYEVYSEGGIFLGYLTNYDNEVITYDNEVITMVKQDTYSNVLYIVLYNEATRQSNESTRGSNETTRQTAETNRNTKEEE